MELLSRLKPTFNHSFLSDAVNMNADSDSEISGSFSDISVINTNSSLSLHSINDSYSNETFSVSEGESSNEAIVNCSDEDSVDDGLLSNISDYCTSEAINESLISSTLSREHSDTEGQLMEIENEDEHEALHDVEFDHMLPLLRSENDVTVKAALMHFWQLSAKVTDAGMTRLLKMLSFLCPESGLPSSTKVMKSLTQHLFADKISEITTEQINDTVINIADFDVQIRMLLSNFHSLMIKYCKFLKSTQNVDILNSKCMNAFPWECSEKSVDLFFLASADGASFTTTTNLSIWPFHLQLLNLPPYIRQKAQNILLLGLISRNGKPSMKHFLPKLIDHLPKSLKINDVDVKIHVRFFVCDLPALSSIFNLKQFNGKFSCPKCLHPGRRAEGTNVWIFPYVGTRIRGRQNESHLQHVMSAEAGNFVFGVKGRSSLDGLIKFPENNPIDTMHCLFEGQIKFIIDSFTNVRLKHLPCFLTPRQFDKILEVLKSVRVPVEYVCTKKFHQIGLWTASELKFFSLHLLLPSFIPFSNNFKLHQSLFCLVAIYHLLYNLHSKTEDIDDLVDLFMETAPEVFSETVLRLNFHLLTHLSDQYEKFGPVYLTSMFAFEALNKVYKSFVNGSRSQTVQIATKFLRYKALSHFLENNKNSTISSAFHSISTTKCRVRKTEVISENVAVWEGKALHSTSYDENLLSSCCCVWMKNNVIGLIERFEDPNNIVLLPINDTQLDLFEHCVSPTNTSTWKYQRLHSLMRRAVTTCKTFNFKLAKIELLKQPIRAKLTDIQFRCISVKISENYNCIVPLVEVHEHA